MRLAITEPEMVGPCHVVDRNVAAEKTSSMLELDGIDSFRES